MNAEWIAPPDCDGIKNYCFLARKQFTLNTVSPSTFIHISADCRYRLFVNGTLVGRGPVRGSTELQYFDSYRIASLLHVGGNEVLIEVFTLLEENFAVNSLAPGVIAEIPGVLRTDTSWETQMSTAFRRDVPHYTMQYGNMEFCDYRAARQPVWQPARRVENKRLTAKKLVKNPLPEFPERYFPPVNCERFYGLPEPLSDNPHEIPGQLFRETQTRLPAAAVRGLGTLFSQTSECVITAPDGAGIGFILNFDAEISGRVEIELDAPAGTTVQIAYGEALTQDRVATEFNSDYHFTDCFILREGMNLVTTAFAERGFRMIQLSIRNFRRPVTIRRVAGVDRRYPMVPRGSFFSSDCRLNRIYDVCAETLHACSSDVFMDCPWRERAFWVNDLLVNNLAALHCFGVTELHRHCFELAFSQFHESGLISAVVPRPCMKETEDNPFVFAPTNLFMVLILQDYWMFSSDAATVRKWMPALERIMNSIWSLADSEGILRTSGVSALWNFYDWCFDQNNYCCNGTRESMLSSLFVLAAKTFIRLADDTGYQFDRAELEKRWRKTAAHFESRFTAPASSLLEDEVLVGGCQPKQISTQLAHALWLLTGEASAAHKPLFEQALTRSDCLMPDYYLHYFWFRAASLTGCDAVGLERIRHYWGRCIDTGSPTLYEAGIHGFGQQAMDGSGSLCHGFGTIPTAFVHEVILGVRALKPGFAEFVFKPNLLDLKFAHGRIPTPKGAIEVQLEPHRSVLTVPPGTCAVLPDGRKLIPGRHCLDLTH